MSFEAGLLFGPIRLSEEDRLLMVEIGHMSDLLYDSTYMPEARLKHYTKLIASDLDAVGCDVSENNVLRCLSGEACEDRTIENYVSCFFGKQQSLPLSVGDMIDMHLHLYKGSGGVCEPGRIRNGNHISVVDGVEVVEDVCDEDPTMALGSLISGFNGSPYNSLVSSILLYGGLKLIRPFNGDERLLDAMVLRTTLCCNNLWGFRLCRMEKHLESCGGMLDSALDRMKRNGDATGFISAMLVCMKGMLSEALESKEELEVKNDLEGTMRAIVRFARTKEDFQMADALYLGDCAPQAFRIRLNGLIDIGLLEKIGSTRNARYRYVDPLDAVYGKYGGHRMHIGMSVGSTPEKKWNRSRRPNRFDRASSAPTTPRLIRRMTRTRYLRVP